MPLDGARKDIAINSAVPDTVYVALHTGYPATLLNEIADIPRQAVTVPRSNDESGTQTCTGAPVCMFTVSSDTIVGGVGIWDSPTTGDGNRIAYFDNADISVAVNDKVSVNTLVFGAEDIAGK